MTLPARICRHQLRHVEGTGWLACDTCHADFTHRDDCPGHGTPQCTVACANGTLTPAAELRAAVEKLRAELPHNGEAQALAKLLERQGWIADETQLFLGDAFHDGALDQNVHDALAVARALNGRTS